MRTFFQFLESVSQIGISIHKYVKELTDQMYEVAYRAQSRRRKLGNFKVDLNYIAKEWAGYPDLKNLLIIVGSGKHASIQKYFSMHFNDMNNWQKQSGMDYMKFRKVMQHLMDYEESIDPGESYSVEKANEEVKFMEQETVKNMEKIKLVVSEAIGRILSWNGSSIMIEAEGASLVKMQILVISSMGIKLL